MGIRQTGASLMLAAMMMPISGAGLAQGTTREEYSVTTRRNFDGSYTTKDSDGYQIKTRRSFDGSYTTKDNEGNSVTCRRSDYAAQVRCRHVTVRSAPGSDKELPEPVEMPEPAPPPDQ